MLKENQLQNKSKAQKKKKNKKRFLFWLLILLFLLVLSTLLFLPALISTKKGNQIVLAQINKHINGTADFSSLSMSWTKGIQISDLQFTDSAGQILLSVKQIHTKPHYLSLLTQAPVFGQTTIDEPDVDINLKNSSTQKTKALPKKPAGSKKTFLPVKKIDLTINNGNLKVTDPQGQTTSISRINCKLNLNPPPKQTSFDITLVVPDKTRPSQITAVGQIQPAMTNTGLNLAKSSGNFTANIDELHLDKLNPLAAYLGLIKQTTQIQGALTSQISVKTENNICKIETEKSQINNLKIYHQNKKPFEQKQITLDFKAQINPIEQSITIDTLQILSPQIKVQNGSFNYATKNNKINLQGQIDCEYDWQTLKSLAAPYLPEDLQIEGKRKDTIIFSARYPADKPQLLLENLNLTTKTGFEKAHYPGFSLGTTETNIKAQKGLLEIEPFSTTANNGKLNFAAQADLKTKPVFLKIPGPVKIIDGFELNDEMAKKYLPYFNPIFANSFNVSGKANLLCETLVVPIHAGQKKDIEVAGTFSVDKLRLQTSQKGLLGQLYSLIGKTSPTQDITVRPTKFTLKNGLLEYDDMQVDIGDNPLNFKGSIGLDKSLNMTVILPYTLKGTTARVDKKTVGKRIELPLKGTIDNPQLDTGKLLETQLKDLLQDQLQQILKDKIKLDTKEQNNQNQTDDKLKETIEDIIRDQLDKLLKEKN